MKKLLKVICLTLGFLNASAFGQTGTVKVNVPFEFFMGQKIYEPGVYGFLATKDTVSIEDNQGNRMAMALTNHISGPSRGKTGQVVFECYAKQCFLSQLWSPIREDGQQLLRSRLQSELAAKKSGTYMALAGSE